MTDIWGDRRILATTWPSGSSMSHESMPMDTWGHATFQDELSPQQSCKVSLAKPGKGLLSPPRELLGEELPLSPLHNIINHRNAVASHLGCSKEGGRRGPQDSQCPHWSL